MAANRIGIVLAGALVLNGCAYGTIRNVPDEMLAAPEEQPDLAAAILAGELDHADHLIATGADIDRRGANGATPLIAAAMTDANAIAERLLALGADSAAKDDGGRNALAWALERDNGALVELLVEHAKTAF